MGRQGTLNITISESEAEIAEGHISTIKEGISKMENKYVEHISNPEATSVALEAYAAALQDPILMQALTNAVQQRKLRALTDAATQNRARSGHYGMNKAGKARFGLALLLDWLFCSSRDSNPGYRLERAETEMSFTDIKHPLLTWIEDGIHGGGVSQD